VGVDHLPLLLLLPVSTIVLMGKDATAWQISSVDSLGIIVSRASWDGEGLRTSSWASRSTWEVGPPSRYSPRHWLRKGPPGFSTKRERSLDLHTRTLFVCWTMASRNRCLF